MKQAPRGNISPFLVMEAFREAEEVARGGADVIHLSLGQPARKAPRRVLEKVSQLALNAQLGYTDARGMESLRHRISAYYHDQYGMDVPMERIFVTVGSSAAYFMSLIAAFEPGDKIAIAAPCYPAYPNIMRALELEPVFMRAGLEENYHPTVDMLKALPEKPAGLVIASPSNPTGTVIDADVLHDVIRYCEAEGIRLISDEIYHGVTYGDVACKSALEYSDRMIVTNSFSKYFLLPGWRLGWAVMPEDLQRNFESLVQNFFISPPAIAQHAAVEVFDCLDELDKVVQGYEINRQILLDALPKAGFDKLSPAQGAFYIYADVSGLTDDSTAFCRKMLEEAHVCAVAGPDFDREEGHNYVRFSYAGDSGRINEACERLKRWLG